MISLYAYIFIWQSSTFIIVVSILTIVLFIIQLYVVDKLQELLELKWTSVCEVERDLKQRPAISPSGGSTKQVPNYHEDVTACFHFGLEINCEMMKNLIVLDSFKHSTATTLNSVWKPYLKVHLLAVLTTPHVLLSRLCSSYCSQSASYLWQKTELMLSL